MGEAKIQYLVAISLIGCLAIATQSHSAYGQSSGMPFPPQSLDPSRSASDAGGMAGNAGLSGSPIMRAGTRADGPTSAPTNPSGNWRGADPPSTDPYQSRTQLANADNQVGFSNPAARNEATPPRIGWGRQPDGINLPQRNLGTPQNGGQFGSSFGDSVRQASQTAADFFGPKTREQAGFDATQFNSSTQQNSGLGAARSAGQAGSFSDPSRVRGTNVDRGLGFPSAENLDSASADSTENWTPQEVANLAAQFNIPANDPNLQNIVFVNDMFLEWLRQTKQRELAAQNQSRTATDALADRRTRPTANDPWANERSTTGIPAIPTSRQGLTPRDGWPTGQSATRTASTTPSSNLRDDWRQDGYRDDRYQSTPSAPGRMQSQPRDPAELYADDYDRRTQMRREEEMEELKRDKEYLKRLLEDEKKKAGQMSLNPANLAGANPYAGFTPGYQAGNPAYPPNTNNPAAYQAGSFGMQQPGSEVSQPTLIARGKQPGDLRGETGTDPSASERKDERAGDRKDVTVDKAGMIGAAEELKRTNPYVNVFLLCSIVANVFLFVWLHRLWQHHRDLIATSRMSSSGISAAD